MTDWKRNIPFKTRMQIKLRDFFVNANGQISIALRKAGLKNDELFKHVLIQTNYSCTRKCSFCHYGQENSPKPYSLPSDIFFSIIDQLAELNYSGRLGLFEMNEPLTDRRFGNFLQYSRIKLPRAWIFISSNGDLLTTKSLSKILSSGLNYIYLSSYDQKALLRNTELINQLSSTNKKKIHHINRTYQRSWSSRGGNISKFKKQTVSAPCDMVFRVLYIKPYGTIHSCYNDFYDKNIMGNLAKNSLKDIWYGNTFKKLRKDLLYSKRSLSELCNDCDYGGISNLPKIPMGWRLWKKQ